MTNTEQEPSTDQLRERPIVATAWLVVCIMAAIIFVQEFHETGTPESALLGPIVAILAGGVIYTFTYHGYMVVKDELS